MLTGLLIAVALVAVGIMQNREDAKRDAAQRRVETLHCAEAITRAQANQEITPF